MPQIDPTQEVKPRQTILTVEDDSAVRCLVREILEYHGYAVIEAESADAALEMWPQVHHAVDLVLTDMVMPGNHNGLQLGRKLMAATPDVRIIYTSGYSSDLCGDDIDLVEGRNYLPKPYLTAALIAILRQALATPRLA